MTRSFSEQVRERDRRNVEKWGLQDFDVLLICTMEELGEIARARLEGESPERIRAEIIDAAALLRRLFIQAGHAPGREEPHGSDPD